MNDDALVKAMQWLCTQAEELQYGTVSLTLTVHDAKIKKIMKSLNVQEK
jgi:hypothetical protein